MRTFGIRGYKADGSLAEEKWLSTIEENNIELEKMKARTDLHSIFTLNLHTWDMKQITLGTAKAALRTPRPMGGMNGQ